MIEAVVFLQEELLSAVRNGKKKILLCDNFFVLPNVTGMTYIALGDVNAEIELSREAAADISFVGFEPKFGKLRFSSGLKGYGIDLI